MASVSLILVQTTVASATQFTVETSCFPHSCFFGGFLASAVCSVVRVNRSGFAVDVKGLSWARPTLLLNNRLSPPPHPRVTSSNTAATTAAATGRASQSAEQGGGTSGSINTRCCDGFGGILYSGYLAGMTLARLCVKVYKKDGAHFLFGVFLMQ